MVAKRKADKLPRRLSIDSVSVESDGSSASSSSELKNYRGAKRKFATSRSTDGDTNSGSDEELDSEELSGSGDESGDGNSGSDSDEDSDFDSDSSLGEETKRTVKATKDLTSKKTTESPSTKKRKRGDDGGDVDSTGITKVKGKAKDEDEDEDEEGGVEGEEEEEVNVLSHKEQRRLRKKQKTLAAAASSSTSSTTNQPALKPGTESTNPNLRQPKSQNPEKPRRQNSVWVGNLSYRTTPESLRAFFENADAKDVTRVHMPTKGVPGLENMKMRMKGVKSVKENRGFAYVDFSTPEAKKVAISLSEKNLDGRRLLIKDGDDFAGRPDPTPANETDPSTTTQTNPTPSTLPIAKGPTTKTAQKILKAQKQPPCPCLFLGNLGFEATEERIEEMIEGHARAVVLGRIRRKKEKVKAKKEKEKEKEKEKGEKMGNGEGSGDDEGDEKVEIDVGIKKIRMGTFEDSGLCKGFAFVDFKSTLHSTAALTNPANHFLDGRALVVEYASAEAARRGGYRPESKTRSTAKKSIGTRQDKTRQQGRRE